VKRLWLRPPERRERNAFAPPAPDGVFQGDNASAREARGPLLKKCAAAFFLIGCGEA
jgi:hypothetical protein